MNSLAPRLAGLLVWLVAATACTPPADEAAVESQLVRVAEVRRASLPLELVFSGVLQPVERAQLAFQSPGVLTSRPVELGQRVRQGELLATLDNPELAPAQQAAAARIQELVSRRDQARRELDRLQALRQSGAVGDELVEQKAAALEALDAAIAQAEAEFSGSSQRLQDATLLAPFDGMIYQVAAEPGEFIAAGQPVVAVGANDLLEVKILVPAAVVDELEIGTVLPVRLSQRDGLEVPGTVTGISTIGEVGSGLFPVVVQLEAGAGSALVRAGMRAAVHISSGSKPGLVLPLSAIVDPAGGDPRVFIIDQAVAHVHPVIVDRLSDESVLVHMREPTQLADGAQVVIAGHRTLVDGQPVRILQ